MRFTPLMAVIGLGLATAACAQKQPEPTQNITVVDDDSGNSDAGNYAPADNVQ